MMTPADAALIRRVATDGEYVLKLTFPQPTQQD
jgi:hypothetical protein